MYSWKKLIPKRYSMITATAVIEAKTISPVIIFGISEARMIEAARPKKMT